MKTLFLKKEFINSILLGKKTQTIRLKTRLKINDFFTINFKPPVCQVINIYCKELKELTLEEIKQDGFIDKESFHKKIKEIYPLVHETDIVYVISFKLISNS